MSDVSIVRSRKYEISSEETLPRGELWKSDPHASSKSTTISSEGTAPPSFPDMSTDEVVRRDTGVTVHTHGADRTQRQTKDHQRDEVGGAGIGSIVHTAVEGVELAEVVHLSAGATVALGVTMPVLGLALGIHELAEARKNGVEQNTAAIRENVHVAVLGSLALPAGYRAERKAKDFPDVPTHDQSVAFKMTEAIAKDGPGKAALQLQCDRGIHAAQDMIASCWTAETFLKAHPKVAEQYAKDAAFHEGFNAYLFASAQKDGGAMKKEMDTGLQRRDGWYAQSSMQVRA